MKIEHKQTQHSRSSPIPGEVTRALDRLKTQLDASANRIEGGPKDVSSLQVISDYVLEVASRPSFIDVLELPPRLTFLRDVIVDAAKPCAAALLGEESSDRGRSTWHALDVPADASWHRPEYPHRTYDMGEAFFVQVNLEEIPLEALDSRVPQTGMLWVFLDLSEGWRARVEFDPRRSIHIPWLQHERGLRRTINWHLRPSLPNDVETNLPSVHYSFETESYNSWVATLSYRQSARAGGWHEPIQGDASPDEVCVLSFERQSFGDSGALYVLFNPLTRAWSAQVMTH